MIGRIFFTRTGTHFARKCSINFAFQALRGSRAASKIRPELDVQAAALSGRPAANREKRE
jgi:hypothetical protein